MVLTYTNGFLPVSLYHMSNYVDMRAWFKFRPEQMKFNDTVHRDYPPNFKFSRGVGQSLGSSSALHSLAISTIEIREPQKRLHFLLNGSFRPAVTTLVTLHLFVFRIAGRWPECIVKTRKLSHCSLVKSKNCGVQYNSTADKNYLPKLIRRPN